MKSEICAEVTAKVAYSVRIMLDHFGEELKATLDAYHGKNGEEGQCSCKDTKKCRACKEKRALLRASHYALKKEEKKLAKMAYKESKKLRKKYLKSSGSESENEYLVADKIMPQSSLSEPLMLKPDCTKAPPIPPRNVSPVKGLTFASSLEVCSSPETTTAAEEHTVNITDYAESKILNGSPIITVGAQKEELHTSKSSENPVSSIQLDMADVITGSNNKDQLLSPSSTQAESYPSPSDSEFEVVSMPAMIDATPETNRGKFYKLIYFW